MAQRNLPTGSVRDPRGSAGGTEQASVDTGGARARSYRERIDALEREVDALEVELRRRDDRLQSVIDRYEAVLANQRHDYQRRIGGTDGRRPAGSETLLGRLSDLLRGG